MGDALSYLDLRLVKNTLLYVFKHWTKSFSNKVFYRLFLVMKSSIKFLLTKLARNLSGRITDLGLF